MLMDNQTSYNFSYDDIIFYINAKNFFLYFNQTLLTFLNVSIEKSGKTLHLLKSGSKPIKPRTQRKKIEILGSLSVYNDSKKKSEVQKE